MKPRTEANARSNSTPRLAILVSIGSLLLTALMVLLATNSYAAPPTIQAVTPSEAPNNFDATIVIAGTDFQVVVSGTTVLTAPVVYLGDTLLPMEGLVTSHTLTATVPWGLSEGVYAIHIENADGTTATLTSAFTVTAGLGTWTTGGPYGGTVPHMEMDPVVTSTVYASLGMAGLFKSEDSGGIWQNIFPGYIVAHEDGFTLKPDDPQTLYLSGDLNGWGGLLRSSNGGTDWEVIQAGGQWVMDVSPGNPEYLYASDGSTILLSTDGGTSFQTASNGIPGDAQVLILAAHPVTPSIAYAGLDLGRVFKTIDSGGTWLPTGASLADAWWSVLEVDPYAPERLYASGWHTAEFFARSLDGGATWEAMTLDPGQASASDLKFHPTISGTIHAMTASGIYSTTDAGETWGKFPMPFEAREGVSLLLHPQTGLPYFIGHNGKGVLRSPDGGSTWTTVSQGLTGLHPHEIAASPADPRTIYLASGESGGFVSNNGGQSWLAAAGPEWAISVAADPYTPQNAYIGDRRDVYRTTDGGQTWTPSPLPGLPDNNEMRVHAIAVDPGDPSIVYAGAGTWDFQGGNELGWLYRSVDAGQSWQPLAVTLPISAVTDITIDPNDSQTIYVATGRRWEDSSGLGTGIVKTTDGGTTWSYANQDLQITNISRLAILPDESLTLYAGANAQNFDPLGGVFKSEDGGANWEQSATHLRVSGLAVDPLVTDTLWAGSYWAGLFQSFDAGASWARVPGPLGELSSLCLDAVATKDRTIVYAGVTGGVVSPKAMAATSSDRGSITQDQFYGNGIYQITLDRRQRQVYVYLPLVVKH